MDMSTTFIELFGYLSAPESQIMKEEICYNCFLCGDPGQLCQVKRRKQWNVSFHSIQAVYLFNIICPLKLTITAKSFMFGFFSYESHHQQVCGLVCHCEIHAEVKKSYPVLDNEYDQWWSSMIKVITQVHRPENSACLPFTFKREDGRGVFMVTTITIINIVNIVIIYHYHFQMLKSKFTFVHWNQKSFS